MSRGGGRKREEEEEGEGKKRADALFLRGRSNIYIIFKGKFRSNME